jgi:exodeoxyribonuclease VII small subunit
MKTFEERMSRLEELTEKIKDGNLPLEEAVSVFEEGIELAKSLEKELSKIERKVEILINKPAEEKDEPKMELFPELDEKEEQ